MTIGLHSARIHDETVWGTADSNVLGRPLYGPLRVHQNQREFARLVAKLDLLISTLKK